MTAYVVDDHPTMRNAIARIVKKILPDTPVIEVFHIKDLLTKIASNGVPTLITLDLKLPDAHGVSGLRQIRLNFPKVPLAVISASPADEMEEHCVTSGADIYLEKSVELSEMKAQLSTLMKLDFTDEEVAAAKLSKRQIQLLKLLCLAKTNAEIAEQLQLTVGGIKVHMWRLYQKISAKNRTDAIKYAHDHGLDV